MISDGYFIRPTGTVMRPDGVTFGDGTLVITPVSPALLEGDGVVLQSIPFEVPVVSGVISAFAPAMAENAYVWAPGYYRFELLDDDGLMVDSWVGELGQESYKHMDDTALGLALVLKTFRWPASVAGYLRDVTGYFLLAVSPCAAAPIPTSALRLTLQSNTHDASNTKIVANGRFLSTVCTITNGLVDATAKLLVPGTYRIEIVDAVTGRVYFDQQGIVVADPGAGVAVDLNAVIPAVMT